MDEKDERWGLTWVGGVLYYDTREQAEAAQHSYGIGSLIPPGEVKP